MGERGSLIHTDVAQGSSTAHMTVEGGPLVPPPGSGDDLMNTAPCAAR